MSESRWWLLPVFLGGAALGLLGGFVQAIGVNLSGVQIPVGLVLVLAALVATQRALVHSWESRTPAAAWFVGWIVMTLVLALPLPGGNVVIAEGAVPIVYLFGGAVLGAAAASLPARIRPADRSPEPVTSPGAETGSDCGIGIDDA
ncbi:MAG: DUF6113 family protein [Candidatus Nanopelagicales bacterium]|nr:DUF6113 family protein [Candidatus Nanopelagicales bacterium]